ncbi:Type II secretion system (T2SS), protein M [Parapedobacter composti]|uniref:Type II secretion system (T2SS), protein M n=1 Tax=Parapedobacter composti TaxID=623281 RepID=A0A1I1M9I1_9SPHI|nr:type II secretion system protein GspM [Parapedobacter composti]SFC79233.1 Type II secretion system (T2SS), protein M [Parapedobacter composti]
MKQLFDRYDWRTRNRMLWGAALLFLLACYLLAIRPTLSLRSEYKTLQAGEAARQANLQALARLRARAAETGQLFGQAAAAGDTAISEPERIARLAEHRKVSVRSLPAPERLGAGALQVHYTEYQLEGSFSALLRLLHDVEQQQGINLLSASFIKQPNPTTRAPELLLQLRTVRLAND